MIKDLSFQQEHHRFLRQEFLGSNVGCSSHSSNHEVLHYQHHCMYSDATFLLNVVVLPPLSSRKRTTKWFH